MSEGIAPARTDTPRYGSRRWAAAQTGAWTTKRVLLGLDGQPGWEIRLAGNTLAVITDNMVGGRPSEDTQAYMINHGSDPCLGNALFGDLCEALALVVAADEDDATPFRLKPAAQGVSQ